MRWILPNFSHGENELTKTTDATAPTLCTHAGAFGSNSTQFLSQS